MFTASLLIAGGCWTGQPPAPQPAGLAIEPRKPRCSGPHCLPELEFVDTNGGRHTRSSLAGKIVVVNFWATWARPSLVQIAALSKVHDTYKARGIVILGILTDDLDDDGLIAFRSTHPISYPIVRVTPEILSAFDALDAIPITIVFGRRGQEVARRVGTFGEEDLTAVLDALVGEPR